MNNDDKQSWEVLSDTEVFSKEPWVRISLQRVRLPNGQVIDDYVRIIARDSVIIFAQTTEGNVIIEKQYKHGVGRHIINLPAGNIEDNEEPLHAAQRELVEETGYSANHWRILGSFTVALNQGYCKAYLVSANNAKNVCEPDSGDLEETEVCLASLSELADAVSSGNFQGLADMATLALATNPLFQIQS